MYLISVPSTLLLTKKRWLIFKGREEEGLANLAWTRKRNVDDPQVLEEFYEITAAIQEERETTAGASFGECIKPGNRTRFMIAFTMYVPPANGPVMIIRYLALRTHCCCSAVSVSRFMLQQWSGQNSISYYAPLIFKSIGITGTSTGLLTSGIYVSTSLLIHPLCSKSGVQTAVEALKTDNRCFTVNSTS